MRCERWSEPMRSNPPGLERRTRARLCELADSYDPATERGLARVLDAVDGTRVPAVSRPSLHGHRHRWVVAAAAGAAVVAIGSILVVAMAGRTQTVRVTDDPSPRLPATSGAPSVSAAPYDEWGLRQALIAEAADAFGGLYSSPDGTVEIWVMPGGQDAVMAVKTRFDASHRDSPAPPIETRVAANSLRDSLNWLEPCRVKRLFCTRRGLKSLHTASTIPATGSRFLSRATTA